MSADINCPRFSRITRDGIIDYLRRDPMPALLGSATDIRLIGEPSAAEWDDDSAELVVAAYKLQELAEYRAALQEWFGHVRPGGHLVVIVPNAFLFERQTELPSRWNPKQRRLYTPASLAQEIEEALVPNSYRVRWLGDRDDGYDYGSSGRYEPEGACDVVVAIEKITQPSWSLTNPQGPQIARGQAPAFEFEPTRTRIEVTRQVNARRILILKLDHVGDLIMGIPALERARALFSNSEITLVVGSWNYDAAKALGIADTVIAFDAFPRNSTEQHPDVNATVSKFRDLIRGSYDLAIDLRTDTDTRILLRAVSAPLKAGLGTRAQFPFLDIFLPLDWTRNDWARAQEDRLSCHTFSSQGPAERRDHRIVSNKEDVGRDCAIVWGPYWRLRPGRYFFEPWLELSENKHGGLLKIDVALDREAAVEHYISDSAPNRISFTVETPDPEFEFRVWAIEGVSSIDFSFFGGALIRQDGESLLHQSEYTSLLIELVAMRLERTGLLRELSLR